MDKVLKQDSSRSILYYYKNTWRLKQSIQKGRRHADDTASRTRFIEKGRTEGTPGVEAGGALCLI
jgi:hypothetical protein